MERSDVEGVAHRRWVWLVVGVLAGLALLGFLGISNALAVADSAGTQQPIEPVVGETPAQAPPPTPSPTPSTPPAAPAPVPAPAPVDIDDDDDDDDDVDDGDD